MPTIIPGYVYSLFAALIIGAILVYSCSLSIISIKNSASTQLLGNIKEYIAIQSLILISRTTEDKQNITQFLDIPSHIGNQRFWIRIANDSSNVWIESGFGIIATSSESYIIVPAQAHAAGTFISGSGKAILQCRFENQSAILTLNGE